VNSEHSRILKALAQRDEERVLTLLKEHREHTIADFEGHLDEG
jgi:DNA-binding GntR family transcriptional regulator